MKTDTVEKNALYPIAYPKSIVFFGASNNFNRMGTIILDSLKDLGFEGPVYPVHPKETEVLGYKAKTVSSGEVALDCLKNGDRFDLLVLDMIMVPGMDGLETYKKILEINPKQKAIIASGFSETERVKETQKIGAGTYLRKPYTLKKLAVAVHGELS